jgi:hypothetical protein
MSTWDCYKKTYNFHLFGHRPQRGQSPLISSRIDVHSVRPSIRTSVCTSVCPYVRTSVRMYAPPPPPRCCPMNGRAIPSYHPSTEMGHREPMTINAFASTSPLCSIQGTRFSDPTLDLYTMGHTGPLHTPFKKVVIGSAIQKHGFIFKYRDTSV